MLTRDLDQLALHNRYLLNAGSKLSGFSHKCAPGNAQRLFNVVQVLQNVFPQCFKLVLNSNNNRIAGEVVVPQHAFPLQLQLIKFSDKPVERSILNGKCTGHQLVFFRTAQVLLNRFQHPNLNLHLLQLFAICAKRLQVLLSLCVDIRKFVFTFVLLHVHLHPRQLFGEVFQTLIEKLYRSLCNFIFIANSLFVIDFY